jgi:hypothetical protein
MKKIMIAAASLMFVASAQASQPEYTMEIGVDVTPIVKQVAVAKTDRFSGYALENIAAGGQ